MHLRQEYHYRPRSGERYNTQTQFKKWQQEVNKDKWSPMDASFRTCRGETKTMQTIQMGISIEETLSKQEVRFK
jgi:hypothetical protein